MNIAQAPAGPGVGFSQPDFFESHKKSHASWSSLVGIITAIVGNILISFALNAQRYAHIRIDREFHDSQDTKKQEAQQHLPKSLRGYGAVAQQEEIAEERARLNASAPGPGTGGDINGINGHRKASFSSEETAKPLENNDEGQQTRKSYLKSPYWWVGIILMTVGEAGNFLAYGFAPASIVSPLGVVALVSNCLIAPLMLKERFRTRDFWGVLIAVGGAVTVVLSAKTSEIKMGPDDLWDAIRRWEFLTYIGITCVFIIVLMYASPRYGRRTILIDLGLVGLFGGYTALSTKGVASMLSGNLWRALTFPITYALIAVLVLSAIMQIRYLNRALSNFNSTQVIPTQFVLFTLSVIIGSAVLYRDFEKTDLDHVVKFIIGCLLTFSGVYLITSGRQNNDEDDVDSVHDENIRLIDEEMEMEDERTPLKSEALQKIDTQVDRVKPVQRYSADDVSQMRPTESPSIPSVAVTPYDDNPDRNFSTSSIDHLNNLTRPRTPPTRRQQTDPGTPFFTPASAPGTAQGRFGLLKRTDSSPADPQTPSKAGQTPDPPKPDISALPPGELLQTPQANIFRSARGSISRLLPGPFITPLSSSLSAMVADSLLKGEGSPQGPIRSRSYRRERALQNTGSEDNRRRSNTMLTDATDLESGLNTPAISRWQTREQATPVPEGSAVEESSGGESSNQQRQRSRSNLLPSFGPSLTRLMSRAKDEGKAPERSGSGSGSGSGEPSGS